MDSRIAKVNIDTPESDPTFLKEQTNPVAFVLRRNSTRAAKEGRRGGGATRPRVLSALRERVGLALDLSSFSPSQGTRLA